MVAPTSVAVPVAQKCGCMVRLCGSGIIHRRVITSGVIWGSRHTPLVKPPILPCGKELQCCYSGPNRVNVVKPLELVGTK